MRREISYVSPVKKTPKPNPQPIDTESMCSLYSTKYDLTFYGATDAECAEKLAEHDRKRGGDRILQHGYFDTINK